MKKFKEYIQQSVARDKAIEQIVEIVEKNEPYASSVFSSKNTIVKKLGIPAEYVCTEIDKHKLKRNIHIITVYFESSTSTLKKFDLDFESSEIGSQWVLQGIYFGD